MHHPPVQVKKPSKARQSKRTAIVQATATSVQSHEGHGQAKFAPPTLVPSWIVKKIVCSKGYTRWIVGLRLHQKNVQRGMYCEECTIKNVNVLRRMRKRMHTKECERALRIFLNVLIKNGNFTNYMYLNELIRSAGNMNP